MTLLDGDNPGTTLAHTYTFASLFKNCTSIQNASGLSLPATTLQKTCYSSMFKGCSKLSSVTMLATNVPANTCLNNWLKDAGKDPSVTSRTVYIAKGMGSAGLQIPTSWTKVEILPGIFSVSDDKKVRFSKGNLYWNGSDWHLETNQYDHPSVWNENHVGHLFWTKDAAASYAEEYEEEGSDSDKFFCDGSDASHTLTVDGQGGLYALSKNEWKYLLSAAPSGRGTGDDKFKQGVKMAGKANCLIIAPDGYTGTIATSYTASEWTVAESQGLVCLPAAGCRGGSNVTDVGDYGLYWSSIPGGEGSAFGLYFSGSDVSPANSDNRSNGYSVRLVYSAQ